MANKNSSYCFLKNQTTNKFLSLSGKIRQEKEVASIMTLYFILPID